MCAEAVGCSLVPRKRNAHARKIEQFLLRVMLPVWGECIQKPLDAFWVVTSQQQYMYINSQYNYT